MLVYINTRTQYTSLSSICFIVYLFALAGMSLFVLGSVFLPEILAQPICVCLFLTRGLKFVQQFFFFQMTFLGDEASLSPQSSVAGSYNPWSVLRSPPSLAQTGVRRCLSQAQSSVCSPPLSPAGEGLQLQERGGRHDGDGGGEAPDEGARHEECKGEETLSHSNRYFNKIMLFIYLVYSISANVKLYTLFFLCLYFQRVSFEGGRQ